VSSDNRCPPQLADVVSCTPPRWHNQVVDGVVGASAQEVPLNRVAWPGGVSG
jgi:hypothetical protein